MRAYARAADEFLTWCASVGVLSIGAVQPEHVATWIAAGTVGSNLLSSRGESPTLEHFRRPATTRPGRRQFPESAALICLDLKEKCELIRRTRSDSQLFVNGTKVTPTTSGASVACAARL